MGDRDMRTTTASLKQTKKQQGQDQTPLQKCETEMKNYINRGKNRNNSTTAK